MATRTKGAFSTIHNHHRKTSSQGQGGRGRRTKIGTSTMNKAKRRSWKAYRGQGK